MPAVNASPYACIKLGRTKAPYLLLKGAGRGKQWEEGATRSDDDVLAVAALALGDRRLEARDSRRSRDCSRLSATCCLSLFSPPRRLRCPLRVCAAAPGCHGFAFA